MAISKTLQAWMDEKGLRDHQVAKSIGLSRVQVSRIRRGLVGASTRTAMRLQELTGMRWTKFLKLPPDFSVKRKRRKT